MPLEEDRLDPLIAHVTDALIHDAETSISLDEASQLARRPPEETPDILLASHKVTQRFKKGKIFTCSIINAKSGACSEDCAFCAQSASHDTGITPHPLLETDEMIAHAESMWQAGATRYSIVTSGLRLPRSEVDSIAETAATIRRGTGLGLCASLGTLSDTMATALKEGGVTTYHHNLETAESFFDEICTTHPYTLDVDTVKLAKSVGFRVCSGGIMGLGETWEQRVELAFTLQKLDVDSIPINFLNPIPGTRLAHRTPLSPWEALRTIALFRLINPDKDITICGGREMTLKDYQSWVFFAGANGIMVGDYLTTQGRNVDTDMAMIRDMEKIHG